MFLNKIKLLAKELLFNYKLSSEEADFINLNKKFWNLKSENSVGVLVEGFLDSPTSIVEKSRLANAVKEVLGLESKVIIRGLREGASNVAPIYRSFGFSVFHCWWLNYINPFVLFPALRLYAYIFLTIKNGEKLVNLSVEGILVGDLIYDSLIRNIPNSYTVESLNIIKHSRIIFRSAVFYYANKNLLKLNKIQAVVTSHNVYVEYGLLCRQAHKAGAIILLKDMNVYKLYTQKMNVNEHFLKVSNSVIEYEYVNSDLKKERNYYLSRVTGVSKQIDVQNAYKNKREYTINESLSLHHSFTKNKKCIFVMAHAFSDAPHVGEGILFKDYYDFLVKTLIKLNSNSNINCFVKSHPSSYMWGEKGAVEKIVDSNDLDNICILPSDYNTSSIINVADVVVTVKGTAGIEFSCAGIPAVIAGKSYYHGFGICCEPESLNEFYDLLNNIHLIDKLDSTKIRKALIVLYNSFNRLYKSKVLPEVQICPGDDYNSLYKEKFLEMSNNLRNGIAIKDDFYALVIKELSSEFYES